MTYRLETQLKLTWINQHKAELKSPLHCGVSEHAMSFLTDKSHLKGMEKRVAQIHIDMENYRINRHNMLVAKWNAKQKPAIDEDEKGVELIDVRSFRR